MKAFFSCGVGDFIAIESRMSHYEKESVTEVVFCTRQHEMLERLIRDSNMFPNCVKFTSLHNRWWKKPGDPYLFCVGNKYSINSIPEVNLSSSYIESLEDFSVDHVINDINYKRRELTKSSIVEFIKRQNEVDCFTLPERYTVIHPFSNNRQHPERDFDSSDWSVVYSYALNNKTHCVILNDQDCSIPRSHRLINLSTQTTLYESFKILEGAEAFIGCASVLSVYASRLDIPTTIKGNWNHLLSNGATREFYYGQQRKNLTVTAKL